MAATIILFISFIAIAHARFGFFDDNNAPPGFRRMYTPPLMQPPSLPGFSRFPRLPTPPPLYVPGFGTGAIAGAGAGAIAGAGFGFPHPFVQVANMPSPGDIKDFTPRPGQFFNGASIMSVSGISRDKDGNVIRTGGTTMLVNDNGVVREAKVGDNPPEIGEPIVYPPMQEFQQNPFFFEPIPFEPIAFQPIEPVDLEYQPKDGENFVSVASSSHSESSNVDGIQRSSGGHATMLNNNGEVKKKAVEFAQGDDIVNNK